MRTLITEETFPVNSRLRGAVLGLQKIVKIEVYLHTGKATFICWSGAQELFYKRRSSSNRKHEVEPTFSV